MKKADAILTADIHLTDRRPICRKDDYLETLRQKLDFIREVQRKHDNCPILDAGDIFDYWKCTPALISWALSNLPDGMVTIPGNHDLPQHNPNLLNKSGLFVLALAKKIFLLSDGATFKTNNADVYGCSWGREQEIEKRFNRTPPSQTSENKSKRRVIILHTMTWSRKLGKPWPGCTDPHAGRVMKRIPNYDLILTGHNHQSFTNKTGGKLLVNPGSIMRRTVDQVDHQPKIYLWFAKENDVIPVDVPIRPSREVISREHIEIEEEKERRLVAFVRRLHDSDWTVGFSFEENLRKFFQENRVNTRVRDIIWEAVEER